VFYYQIEFVDESGNKQLRNKKVRILKDKDGNEILMVIIIFSNIELIVQLKIFIFMALFSQNMSIQRLVRESRCRRRFLKAAMEL